MANLKYRASSTEANPSSTTIKGTPLTNLEVDANFKSLNDELILKATSTSVATVATTADTNALAFAIALG